MITENLSTLKIHKLSQSQYNRELEAGNIDGNALYLTPENDNEIYDKIYPIGSVWVGGKYESPHIDTETGDIIHAAGELINPADLFGGTWKLVDKEFKRSREYSSATLDVSKLKKYICHDDDRLGTNVDVTSLTLDYSGHSITATITSTTAAPFTDSVRTLLCFDLPLTKDSNNPWGVMATRNVDGSYENIIHARYTEGMSDMSGSMCMLKAQATSDGLIEVVSNDNVPTGELSIGSDINFTFTMDFLPKNMLDEFCDKFYWKRIDPTEVI